MIVEARGAEEQVVGGGRKGKRKVRDKGTENGIGQPHACRGLSRAVRYAEGRAQEGGGLSDTGSPVLLYIVPGKWFTTPPRKVSVLQPSTKERQCETTCSTPLPSAQSRRRPQPQTFSSAA